MEFTEFAQKIKPIIGGSYSTHVFTRTLFESIITEEGLLQIEDISENTFKAYYNGQTKITKISQRILPHIDPEQFIAYLDGFPEATTQRLCDTFESAIGGVLPVFPSLREIPGAEDDNRPEALLAAVCAAPAKVIVGNTVSVVEEKAPFQPPLFAHAWHFSLLSAVSAGISG